MLDTVPEATDAVLRRADDKLAGCWGACVRQQQRDADVLAANVEGVAEDCYEPITRHPRRPAVRAEKGLGKRSAVCAGWAERG